MESPLSRSWLEAEKAREAVRAQCHVREVERSRGVSWSGLGPDAYRPRSPAALTASSELAARRRQVWRASREGRIISAVTAAQQAAEAAHGAGEAIRAALARGAEGDEARCLAAAVEAEAQALALLAAARQARAAASE